MTRTDSGVGGFPLFSLSQKDSDTIMSVCSLCSGDPESIAACQSCLCPLWLHRPYRENASCRPTAE